uniref:Podocalyxin n=1 Tax=Salvator merianae TaxID=96440 RepID=A0A8D0BFN8_SALMN
MRSARRLLLAWLLASLFGGVRGDDPVTTVKSTTLADSRTTSKTTVAPPTLPTVRTGTSSGTSTEAKEKPTTVPPVSTHSTTRSATSKGGDAKTNTTPEETTTRITTMSATSQKTTSPSSSLSTASKTSLHTSPTAAAGSLTTKPILSSTTSQAPSSSTKPSSGTPLKVTLTTLPSEPKSSPKSSADVTTARTPTVTTIFKSSTATPAGGSSVTSPKEETTKNVPLPAVRTSQPPRSETSLTTTKPSEKTMSTPTSQPSGAVPQSSPTSPGALGATTKTPSASTIPLSRSPPSGSGETSAPSWDKITCEEGTLPNNTIILTWTQPVLCKNLKENSLKDSLLTTLCRAVKPNFNHTRDKCTAHVVSDSDSPTKLAVLVVLVQTNLEHEELFESLAGKKGDLEKIGVSNITLGERTMDPDTEDRFSMPLIITIVCMATSLLLVAAIYGCCHQRISQRKDQQRLTEELQTMENGYHDNPTLEVMETSSEMQEKKVSLNGELGDSWIVPMDSLMKEDLEEEEDTHL